MASGVGGSVTKITTNAGGAGAAVSFPASPGPPPTGAHDEIYPTVPEPFLGELKRAQSDGLKVDVTEDAEGNITSVSVKT